MSRFEEERCSMIDRSGTSGTTCKQIFKLLLPNSKRLQSKMKGLPQRRKACQALAGLITVQKRIIKVRLPHCIYFPQKYTCLTSRTSTISP